MIALTILFGLIGLGIIIFVHELGHFLAAKAGGIDVETFSLGWGKRLAGFTRGGTEYRISWFPLGGYCKMKGEMLRANLEQAEMDRMRGEEGSYLAASPWKRIVVVLAGPLANMVFAVVVLSFIWWVGFSTFSWPNKIIVAPDYMQAHGEEVHPARQAGLESGDRIVAMNGRPVESFWDITEVILQNPGTPVLCEVERRTPQGTTALEATVTPDVDPDTGQPVIGIHAWIEPVIGTVAPDRAAALSGFAAGDRILRVDGREVRHSVDFERALQEAKGSVDVLIERGSGRRTLTLVRETDGGGAPDPGFEWDYSAYRSPRVGLFGALGRGFTQTADLIRLTLMGIGRLLSFRFKGLQLAGPIRMTQIMGEAATAGFDLGIGVGFVSFFRILGFISVAIGLTQLLPIPVLDGGQFVLNAFEGLRRKALGPKFIYRFQITGIFIILIILVTTIMSDILSFVR